MNATELFDLSGRIAIVTGGSRGIGSAIAEDYAGMAILLASKASDFVTGQTIFVDGGSNLI